MCKENALLMGFMFMINVFLMGFEGGCLHFSINVQSSTLVFAAGN